MNVDNLEAVENKVDDALERIAKFEQQKEDMLRMLADQENARKRSEKAAEIERKYAHSKFARDLLPILDNLDRAVAAAKEDGPLLQGIRATQTQIMELFKRYNITAIETEGKFFDHNVHQAVQMMPDSGHPPFTVLQVLERGFMIHDRVLRPASVVVSS